MILVVALPGQGCFDYAVPDDLASVCALGIAVEVPIGPRRVVGYVVDQRETSPHKLRAIYRPLTDVVPLSSELLALARFVADYYLAELSQVLALIVPAPTRRRVVEHWSLSKSGKLGLKHDPPIADLAEISRKRTLVSLARAWKVSQTVARQRIEVLVGLGLVEPKQRLSRVTVAPQAKSSAIASIPLVLRPEQAEALAALSGALDSGIYQGFLLWGITGSGKTEVYLAAIAHALASGRTALVLVPEIGLTPQTEARFVQRFPGQVVTIHSAMTQKARREAWTQVAGGEVKVVVGPRSALFAPLQHLGVIVVDEEHDDSYKQDEIPRYHARDVALVRARAANAVAILGSATPSLETLHNVERNKLRLLRLADRPLGSVLPSVAIVSLGSKDPAAPKEKRKLRSGREISLISETLHQAIVETVNRQEQVILFLNRRGFAPFVVCTSCGQGINCPNCSVSLTHHLKKNCLLCHYCGHVENLPLVCAACSSPALTTMGSGTERLEIDLRRAFPHFRICRLDRDVAEKPGALRRSLDEFRAGRIDILVGTQMVTKGHDFPKVTLVGVLFADAALNFPDFRAAERATQLLVQVAGRAGRSDRPGQVIIQTFFPGHPSIAAAERHDYEGFGRSELLQREELSYPPFSKLLLLRGEADDEAELGQQMAELAEKLSQSAHGVELLGPAPAPIERLRGKYRSLILLKAASARPLRELVQRVLLGWQPISTTKLVLDVDPVSML